MNFVPPLVSGQLIARYKRFLFDAILHDGREITGSCPNTGSMAGLTAPGSRIWMSVHSTEKRKYAHAWQMIEADGTIVGINASFANKIAEEAWQSGRLSFLSGYTTIERERKYGRNSRIDFLFSADGLPPAYVEVKNVHFMREPGLAEFPDTKTIRGAKHLEELGDMAEAGARAIMLYVVQRGDCDRVKLCRDLDPNYCAAFDRAISRGVEAYAINCRLTPEEITADRLIPVDEPGID
ncbi:DNA/RNA nuclease SfsA [Rhizobium sp. L1K21]|uniref:DNA/RNA nuclease SfsA n=1 Tax=Rhizobium sp. L1K21 TaxID=2954933 RepID=UPI002093C37C|nr:DNA/RNA nuclease SfsA [Rhizobium sp. L1K21]MCO6185947.1 DNA/RNA nuclease SfsA [Rhizobium sp. L1K21]